MKKILFILLVITLIGCSSEKDDLFVRKFKERIEELKTELKSIIELYSKDSALIKQVKIKFIEMWDSYESLCKVRLWFESINAYFYINMIGKVLAQTNAKRCYSGFPDLI